MQRNKSNFLITFDNYNGGFDIEQTAYSPVLIGDKVVKYDNELATSLLDLLNNYDKILKIFDKYQKKCIEQKINDYSEFVRMFESLKKEILKQSNNLYILIFFIDILIFDILEIQNGNLYIEDELYLYCANYIFSLKEELSTAKDFALSTFFRTYNVTGEYMQYTGDMEKDFYDSAYETFKATQLSLPNVEIKFDNIEYNSNLKEKMEPYSFTYSIFSIADLVNVTLYHLQKNERAILRCANCKKYFVPTTHINIIEREDSDKVDKKLIKERNTRVTCSDDCLNERRREKTKQNLYGYKKEKKNLRDSLRNMDKRHDTNLLEEFDFNFKKKEAKLIEKYGSDNLEIIEQELLQYVLNIKNSSKK